jgi:hypothetical protein
LKSGVGHWKGIEGMREKMGSDKGSRDAMWKPRKGNDTGKNVEEVKTREIERSERIRSATSKQEMTKNEEWTTANRVIVRHLMIRSRKVEKLSI